MSIHQNNEKIEKYLDELADEYKKLLFNALVERSHSIEDLNVGDLLRLDNEVKKHLLIDYRRNERKRKALFLGGFVYMLIGVFLFLCYEITNWDYHASNIMPLLSVVIGFMGLIFSILSFMLPSVTNSRTYRSIKSSTRDDSISLLKYDVVATWRDIEGLANDIALDQDIKTPRSAIEFFLENNLIDKEEYIVLKDFLKLRNEVVHSSALTISFAEMNRLIRAANDILSKLKKVLE